jgi:hypothetical protein
MCRSRAEGGRRCPGTGAGPAGRGGSDAMSAPGTEPVVGSAPAGQSGLRGTTASATAAPQDRPRGRRLTTPRLAALRQAAAHPKGSFPSLTARTEIVLEQLGYAASIDDCGHVNTDAAASQETEHRYHPHFLRITPAGRAALIGQSPS